MICFVLWLAVIGEKASKYRDDRRYRDLTQATVRSCLIMSSQQDGTWAAVPTNLYYMTTPDPVEPEFFGWRAFKNRREVGGLAVAAHVIFQNKCDWVDEISNTYPLRLDYEKCD